jgi:hypothetical protein
MKRTQSGGKGLQGFFDVKRVCHLLVFSVIRDRCNTGPVIPAKAGIQCLKRLRVADKAAFTELSHSVRIIGLAGFPPSRE